MLTDKDKTNRIPKAAGWIDDLKELPTGPSGRPLCRYCGTETKPPRKTFCSDPCVHEWKLRTQPSYQARHVLARDKGVCRTCGLDCLATLKELRDLRRACRIEKWGQRAVGIDDIDLPGDVHLDRFTARCDELALPKHLRGLCRRLWEMDHETPVVEGGGSCGLDNLRTLCYRCHKAVTAELRKRLSKKPTDGT